MCLSFLSFLPPPRSPSLRTNGHKSDDVLTAFRKYTLRGGMLASRTPRPGLRSFRPARPSALSFSLSPPLFPFLFRKLPVAAGGCARRGERASRRPCPYLAGPARGRGRRGAAAAPSRWCRSCHQLCPPPSPPGVREGGTPLPLPAGRAGAAPPPPRPPFAAASGAGRPPEAARLEKRESR